MHLLTNQGEEMVFSEFHAKVCTRQTHCQLKNFKEPSTDLTCNTYSFVLVLLYVVDVGDPIQHPMVLC